MDDMNKAETPDFWRELIFFLPVRDGTITRSVLYNSSRMGIATSTCGLIVESDRVPFVVLAFNFEPRQLHPSPSHTPYSTAIASATSCYLQLEYSELHASYISHTHLSAGRTWIPRMDSQDGFLTARRKAQALLSRE